MKGGREVSGVEGSDVQAEAKASEKKQGREVRRYRRLVSHLVITSLAICHRNGHSASPSSTHISGTSIRGSARANDLA